MHLSFSAGLLVSVSMLLCSTNGTPFAKSFHKICYANVCWLQKKLYWKWTWSPHFYNHCSHKEPFEEIFQILENRNLIFNIIKVDRKQYFSVEDKCETFRSDGTVFSTASYINVLLKNKLLRDGMVEVLEFNHRSLSILIFCVVFGSHKPIIRDLYESIAKVRLNFVILWRKNTSTCLTKEWTFSNLCHVVSEF